MLTTPRDFKRNILKGMRAELTKKLTSSAFKTSIHRGVRIMLGEALQSQDEYLSMVTQDGKLRAELGVADSNSVMDSLVRDWVRSVNVRVAPPRVLGDRIVGTVVSVTAIQSDYHDVLDKAYASYTTEKGQEIPWLDWLLTKGVSIMVATHHSLQLPNVRSRTGTNTVMVKTKGQGWGVPTEYAGTPENNYAQRAVMEVVKEGGPLEQLMTQEVRRRF